MSAASLNKSELLNKLTQNGHSNDNNYASLIERLTTMIGASGSRNEIEQLIRKACLSRNVAILKGVADGYRNRRSAMIIGNDVQKLLVNTFFETSSPEQSNAILNLLNENGINDASLKSSSITKAATVMKDSAVDYRKRAAAVKFLELGDVKPYEEDLKKLIAPHEEPIVQMAAINTLANVKGTVSSEYLIAQWPVLTPEVRSAKSAL